MLAVGVGLAVAALAAAGGIRDQAELSACERTARAIADAAEGYRVVEGAYPAHLDEMSGGRFFDNLPGTGVTRTDVGDIVRGGRWTIRYRFVAPAGYELDRSGCTI